MECLNITEMMDPLSDYDMYLNLTKLHGSSSRQVHEDAEARESRAIYVILSIISAQEHGFSIDEYV